MIMKIIRRLNMGLKRHSILTDERHYTSAEFVLKAYRDNEVSPEIATPGDLWEKINKWN